jgi:hypothetical protein
METIPEMTGHNLDSRLVEEVMEEVDFQTEICLSGSKVSPETHLSCRKKSKPKGAKKACATDAVGQITLHGIVQIVHP